MSKLDYRNIEQSPACCGGQPVVVGTRVRGATVLTCYRLGMRVKGIIQQYPALIPAMFTTPSRMPMIIGKASKPT